MATSISSSAARMPADPLRSDLSGLRAGSHMARMAVKDRREQVIELVREVMADTGTSQKALALQAGQPESVVCDALSPTGSRNLAAEWLLDQPDAFLLALLDKIRAARGLTEESRRAAKAARIGELVKLLVEEVA